VKPVLVVFAPAYAPQIGGVETHLAHVHRALAADLEIHVFVRHAPGLPSRQVRDGVVVRRLPALPAPAVEAWLAARHGHLLRRAHAIHSHDVFQPRLRRLLRSKRWIHTFHGYEAYPVPEGAIAARRRVRAAVDHCVAIGAFIEEWYGTPCEDVLYGAAATTARAADPPAWDAIFYGRLEEDTGFRAYLEAFAAIRQRHPRARLLVVGDGSMRAAATNAPSVELRPATPDVESLVARSAVAFASGYLAIVEAAQIGRPVVTYFGTPIKESYLRCHPMAAHLRICSSAEEIAGAFDRALQGPDDALTGWARAQTWQRVADVYRAAYEIG
jgi:glycosyltransferase involved in cell wall biosynthesis